MIIEQAFFALPEFLVGTGFAKYDSEGTLVMSYAMAVLQELNGRNVNNPIALINAEKTYPNASARAADLHLDVARVGTHNPALAKFGFHVEGWLEAKFFRKNNGKPTVDLTKATYVLLRDLLRLAILPSQVVGQPLSSGRYLLHAYQGSYDDHLAMERNSGTGEGRVARGWLASLHKPGTSTFQLGDLTAEPVEFDKQIGPLLRDLAASLTVTTFAIASTTSEYQLYLTRLDAFSVERGASKIDASGSSSAEMPSGYWSQLANDFDSQLIA